MRAERNPQIEVELYYTENGADIQTILQNSILLFIQSEVKKLCR